MIDFTDKQIVAIVREAHELITHTRPHPYTDQVISGIKDSVLRLTGYTLWFDTTMIPAPEAPVSGRVDVIPRGSWCMRGDTDAEDVYWPHVAAYRVVKPKVDRDIRGPVEVTCGDEVDLRYAMVQGLRYDKHMATVSDISWEQAEERNLVVRALTPADLGATDE